MPDGELCHDATGLDGAVDLEGTCIEGSCARLPWVGTGDEHACALFADGSVFCWGDGRSGALGYGNLDSIGDGIGISVRDAGPVPIDSPVSSLTVGVASTCAVVGGALRCWGYNELGYLGYGDKEPRGGTATTTPSLLTTLPLGMVVQRAGAGLDRSCAISESGGIRCWGASLTGYPDATAVATAPGDPTPAELGDVALVPETEPFVAVEVIGAQYHACALSQLGRIKCWGQRPYIGIQSPEDVGDDEAPSAVGFVNDTWTAIDIAAFAEHSCAIALGGDVYCWGDGAWGKLGNEADTDVIEPIQLAIGAAGSAKARQVATGAEHTCILTDSRRVRCWGQNGSGQLGRGDTETWGNELGEVPGSAPLIDLGSSPTWQIAAGTSFTCAVARNAEVRCWGANTDGTLGIGSKEHIGDEPGEMPPAPITFR